LAQVLRDGPLWVKQAIDRMSEAGFTKDQARRAKERLKVRSEKFGKPGDAEQGWKWVLPNGGTKGQRRVVLNPCHLRRLRECSCHLPRGASERERLGQAAPWSALHQPSH
jgi:hypothetical protein